MPHDRLRPVPAVLAAAAAIIAVPAMANTVVESFDGDTAEPNTTAFELASRGDETPLETAFSIVSQGPDDDALRIAIDPIAKTFGDTGRAQVRDLTVFSTFTVSTDVVAETINFTDGGISVFALASTAIDGGVEGPLAGYQFQVDNVGFNSDKFRARLLGGGMTLAESGEFDLTFFNHPASFKLRLTGTRQPGGDLELVGTFTPGTPNQNDLAPIILTATVGSADFDRAASLYGVRQVVTGNNDIVAVYDDVTVEVAPAPEPEAGAGD